ncbi:MAG TPA: tetratricopeptide repeat protein [Myxococcaceae bacterium]|nr:tetratricopeptide repeat protein [Myxococcaceae bacterium]
MRVARPAAAVVDLGPKARVLSLVRVDGPGDAPEVVVHTLKGRAARQGWFQVEAWKPGDPVDASGRHAYVSIDVAEWSFASPKSSGGGTEPQARVRLLTRVARSPDGPWSEPYETGGLVEGSESASDLSHAGESQLLLESTLRAVDDLLRALAPRPRVEEVEMEVDSPLLQPGVTAATRGDLEEARESFESVHKRHPELAGASYDLGLVLEALGRWEEAEALYADAVSKKDDRLYRDALESVRRRLRSQASGYPP